MSEHQHIIDQWAEGNLAPYDLFEDRFGNLCEAGQDLLVLVRKDEPISAEVAEKVAKHHRPLAEGKMEVLQFVGFDDHGEPVTTVTETDYPIYGSPLTFKQPTLPDEEDMHCDMCGEIADRLSQIGVGWYCRKPRLVNINGQEVETNCMLVRINQLEKPQ